MNKVILGVLAGLIISGCVSTGNNSIINNDNVKSEYFPVEQTIKTIYLDNDERIEKNIIAGIEEETIIKIIEKGQVLFRNKPVYASDKLIVSYLNGEEYYRDLATHFYTLNPLEFKGFLGSQDDRYSISNQYKDLPKQAKIGDSERFITETVYYDEDFSQKKYAYDQAWSLSAASPNTAWFCIETFDKDPQGIEKDILSYNECYEIDNEGHLLRYKDVYVNVPIYSNPS